MPGLRPRLAALAAVAALGAAACAPPPPPPPPPPPSTAPNLAIASVVGNLDFPWDLDWLPDQQLLFTQRTSGLFVLRNGAPGAADGRRRRLLGGQ